MFGYLAGRTETTMFELRFFKSDRRNKFRYEKNYSPMGDVYPSTMVECKGKRIYATNWILTTPLFVVRLRLVPATW
jgi:hypothetical protein